RLAANRLRRQVGSVGLDQDQLIGQLRRGLAQILGAGEGDDPGKGAVPAALDRVIDPPGSEKAVQDHRHAVAALIEDAEAVVAGAGLALGFAGVDHDRQPPLTSDLDLRFEAAALVLTARRLAVIVDAGLAYRPPLLVLGRQPGNLLGPGSVETNRLGRV